MIETQQEKPPRPAPEKTSIVDLAGDLKDEFVHLFRATTQLLRVELTENVQNATAALSRTLIGVAVTAAGGLMLLLGIDLAIINLLAPEYMSYPVAAAVSTIGLAIILGTVGCILIYKNKNALKAEELIPDRTLATLEEHAEWISRKTENPKS